jgi:hypothetical protein
MPCCLFVCKLCIPMQATDYKRPFFLLNCFHNVAGWPFSNKLRSTTQIFSITTQFIKSSFMGSSWFLKKRGNIK